MTLVDKRLVGALFMLAPTANEGNDLLAACADDAGLKLGLLGLAQDGSGKAACI
jgi:hypothetical protein